MFSNSLNQSDATHRIPVIGIVGGIGSGKSTVTRKLAEKLKVLVIDADHLGHLALHFDDVKMALRTRFGDEIFEDGEVRRGALAQQVFGDDEKHRAARSDLEQIIHPAIERQILDLIAEGEHEHYQVVLLDAAVLFEAGWQGKCDAVVFVDAPDDVRHRRVATRSGWSRAELQRRESSQLPLPEKKRRSTYVISNATDDSKGADQLLDFLSGRQGDCCKPLPNSSQQP